MVLEEDYTRDGVLKKQVWCIGCDSVAQGRGTDRIKGHAQACKVCSKLNFEGETGELIPILALQAMNRKFPKLVDRSRGNATANSTQSQATLKKVSCPSKVRKDCYGQSSLPSSKLDTMDVESDNASTTQSSSGQSILYSHFNSHKISPQKQANLDLHLFCLIVCAGLSFNLLDNPWFWDFVAAFEMEYQVPDHSAWMTRLLLEEMVHYQINVKEYLLKEEHLTLSFNSWTSMVQDEIYTAHATTASRRSIMIDGHELTGELVTGELLAQRLEEVSRIEILKMRCTAYTLCRILISRRIRTCHQSKEQHISPASPRMERQMSVLQKERFTLNTHGSSSQPIPSTSSTSS